MPTLFNGRTRRHSTASCFNIVSSPSPTQATSVPVASRKHIRRFSSMGNCLKGMKAASQSPQQHDGGDLGISYPWNFEHKVHVDEHLNGLPPTWSALMAANNEQESEVVAAQVNFFCLGKKAPVPQPKAVAKQPREPNVSRDEEISKPWGTQHNIHVDENLNGLPPAWALLLSQSAQEKTQPLAGGDPQISLPWNFKRDIHVYVGADGVPRGLPPALVARLPEVGYTEATVAAINNKQ